MKLDAHPKSMALIMLALGVCGIGIILVAAFFDEPTMLGVGIALGILGAAAAILGCIHRTTKGEYTAEDKPTTGTIAPERVPSPSVIMDRDHSFEAAGQGLYYEPCSVSPPRNRLGADGTIMSPEGGGTVIPMDYNGGVMSPYAQRTFPVPMSPGAGPMPRNPSAFVVPKEWDTPARHQQNANASQWSPNHH